MQKGNDRMFSLFKKKPKKAFQIDCPKFSVVPETPSFISALKASNIEYKLVTEGYITFEGKAFSSDTPLVFGIHFDALTVKFIEIFRPNEYYQADSFNINKSFSELSDVLRKHYGQPLETTAASIDGHLCEQWHTPNYIVNHYITDRFGFEEHLHINFYKS